MKGFKTVKDFTFPREKGFTGSAGLTPVRGYFRGGKAERASMSQGNAGTRRDDPVTEVDRSPLGGRSELRPGFAKGGRNKLRRMKRAEGGKVKKEKVADERSFLEKLLGSGTVGKAGEKLAGRRRQIDEAVDAAERGYAHGGYAKGGESMRGIAKDEVRKHVAAPRPSGHGIKRRYAGFARTPLIGK